MGHDSGMGSSGDKPRKPKHPLAKVPKYEEPNELPLPGLGGGGGLGLGRFGHGSDRHHGESPGRVGTFVLRILGKHQRGPGES
jgi:hypothetical protein